MDFYLKVGSSTVDWCESNYKIVPFIAEFFNTISNALFFIIPPYTIYLFKDYANYVSKGIYLIWLLVIAVGLGSVYFHSTLSLAGQLMDELLILWVLMICYASLFPADYLPHFIRKNRNMFSFALFLFTLFATYLCCLKTELNAYFLMIFTIPIMTISVSLVKRCENKRIKILGKRTIIIWTVSVIMWLADRGLCNFWIKIKFPYFHSIFHMTAFLSAHWSIVLFAYFAAVEHVPHLNPALYSWPELDSNDLIFIPYIRFLIPIRSSSIPNNLYKDVEKNEIGLSFKYA